MWNCRCQVNLSCPVCADQELAAQMSNDRGVLQVLHRSLRSIQTSDARHDHSVLANAAAAGGLVVTVSDLDRLPVNGSGPSCEDPCDTTLPCYSRSLRVHDILRVHGTCQPFLKPRDKHFLNHVTSTCAAVSSLVKTAEVMDRKTRRHAFNEACRRAVERE